MQSNPIQTNKQRSITVASLWHVRLCVFIAHFEGGRAVPPAFDTDLGPYGVTGPEIVVVQGIIDLTQLLVQEGITGDGDMAVAAADAAECTDQEQQPPCHPHRGTAAGDHRRGATFHCLHPHHYNSSCVFVRSFFFSVVLCVSFCFAISLFNSLQARILLSYSRALFWQVSTGKTRVPETEINFPRNGKNTRTHV